MKHKHDAVKNHHWNCKYTQDDTKGIPPESFTQRLLVLLHENDTHGKHNHHFQKQSQQEQVVLLIVALPNAGPDPRTVVVHLLNTNPTQVAVTRARRTIQVAGSAKLYSINLSSISPNVAKGLMVAH